jgi:hypothetical protein
MFEGEGGWGKTLGKTDEILAPLPDLPLEGRGVDTRGIHAMALLLGSGSTHRQANRLIIEPFIPSSRTPVAVTIQ